MSETLLHNVLIPFVKGLVTVVAVGLAAGVLTWIERRLLGRLQIRKGPNRVGPQGFFQWIADTIKLVFKEDIVPSRAEKALHLLGPLLLFTPAVVVLGLVPWGPEFTPLRRDDAAPRRGRRERRPSSSSSRSPRSASTGSSSSGWASNSKYPLLGGLRSAAQLISYEVPMGLAVVAAILMSSSLSMVEIIEAQRKAGVWFVFPGLIAFFLYFVSGRRRDEPDPLRPPRGRERARRRLPHGVLGLPLGGLLHVRVREHDLRLGRRDDALLRRLAPPLPERRVALVPRRRSRPSSGSPGRSSSSSSSTSGSGRRSRATGSTSSWPSGGRP